MGDDGERGRADETHLERRKKDDAGGARRNKSLGGVVDWSAPKITKNHRKKRKKKEDERKEEKEKKEEDDDTTTTTTDKDPPKGFEWKEHQKDHWFAPIHRLCCRFLVRDGFSGRHCGDVLDELGGRDQERRGRLLWPPCRQALSHRLA